MICRLISNTVRTADWVLAHVLVKVGELIDNAIPSDEVIRAWALSKQEEEREVWEAGELYDAIDDADWAGIYNTRRQTRRYKAK